MADKLAADKPNPGSSGIKKIITWAMAAVFLMGGSIAGTVYVMGYLNHPEQQGFSAAAPDGGHGSSSKAPSSKAGPPQYLVIDPPFVVNFEDQGILRYLQLSLAIMSRDKATLDAATASLPHIRNNLIILISSQNFASLSSPEGKEKIRSQCLEEIRSILQQEANVADVEAIYITNFVMQ